MINIHLYRCNDCGYTTNRKNNLQNHFNETCKIRRQKSLLSVKDKECRFCFKSKRHNGLRSHIHYFIKMFLQKKTPSGLHGTKNLQDHLDYLDEILRTK